MAGPAAFSWARGGSTSRRSRPLLLPREPESYGKKTGVRDWGASQVCRKACVYLIVYKRPSPNFSYNKKKYRRGI